MQRLVSPRRLTLLGSLLLSSGMARGQATLANFQLTPPGPHAVTAAYGLGSELNLSLSNSGIAAADWKLVFEGDDTGGLPGVLAAIQEDAARVLAPIPDRYLFSEGITGTSISDGGGDMYDGGNTLTAGTTVLSYSDNAVVTRTAGTGSVSYFTRKLDGLFVFAGDFTGVDSFSITGNLGADGSGQVAVDQFTVQSGGTTYQAYVHRVHGAGDPSINHLILVPSKPGLGRTHLTTTDNENHRITGLGASSRLYYLLFSKSAGGLYPTTVFQDLAAAFLDTVAGGPGWAFGDPAQGRVEAGASGPVKIALDAAGLAPGTYPTRFAVVPKTMAYSAIPAATFRDLTLTVTPPAFTVESGTRSLATLSGLSPDPLVVPLVPATAGSVLAGLQVSATKTWVTPSVAATPNAIRLDFNTSALATGTHQAEVEVWNNNARQTIAVSVVVSPLAVRKFLPDPARPRIYAINGTGQEQGTLLVIDTLTRTVLRNIPLGRKPTDCSIGDGGDTLFAINAVDQTINEIDLETLAITKTHTLPGYTNWGAPETHAHVLAGKGDILYFVDGQWGPRLRVFNRTTGLVLQTFGASTSGTSNDDGIGGLAMTPDGSTIFTWKQYGWSAGTGGSYISKFRIQPNGTLTYDSQTPAVSSANFDRDPLDTPALTTADGSRLIVKDRAFLTADLGTVATIYPDEIYSIAPNAEIAAGSKAIYSGLGGEILHTLPVTTTVQTITPDYRYLLYFNPTAASIVWLDLVATLGMDALGLEIEPADGATVAAPDRLSWIPITGVRRYQVFYGTDRAAVENGTPGSAVFLGETGESGIDLPTVPTPGQTLYWRVVPLNDDGSAAGAGTTRSFFVSPITLSRSSIAAETVEGVTRHLETIELSAASPQSWSASANVPWIAFQSATGTTPGDLVAVLDASTLAAGFHQGSISITSNGVSFDVPVTLRVHAANFMISEGDLELPWVYAISQASNTATTTSFLVRIDTATDRIESAVPCGRSVTDLAIHYHENRIYLTNWQTGILRAFDRGTFKQVQTYQFAPVGATGYGEGGIWRLSAGKAGRVILEESDQWIDIRLINTANGAVVATNSSEYAGDGEADPTGRYYYHAESLSSSDSMVRFDISGDSFVRMTPTNSVQGTSVVMIGDGSKVTAGNRVFDAQLGLLYSLPSEVRAGTLHGDLLFAGNKAYNGSNGLEVATLPITASVMSVTGDQQKLYLFPPNSKTFRSVRLSDIAPLPPRSMIPTIPDGSTANGTAQSLAWSLEPFANSYRVFFGTDRDAVANATTGSPQFLGTTTTNAWSGALPALALGSTYYWRVDAVGFSGTTPGPVWSFSIAPLTVTPGTLDLAMAVSSPAETRALAISGPAGATWTASTTTPWLSVVTGSGTVPGNLDLRVNPAGLTAGIRSGSVLVQSGGRSWNIPVKLEMLALNYIQAKADLELPYLYAISQAATGTDDRAFMVVIDTRTNAISRVVPVGRSVTDFSIHYPENRIYLSNWKTGKLLALDRTTLAEVQAYTYEPAGATGYGNGDVYKVAAGRNGRLIFEEQDQWIDLFLIDTATGTKLSSGFAREGGGVFDPAGRYYFHGENNSSGAELLKFDTTGDKLTEVASKRVESFSYYGSRRVLASGDGSRIYWNGGVFDPALNVTLLLNDEVVAATYRGEIVFTDDSAFNGVSGEKLATLPVSTTIQDVSGDQRKLFLFKGAAMTVVDLSTIAGVPPRGLIPGIADGATVIGTTQELSWSQEAAALSYDIYFGSSAAAVTGAGKTSAQYLGNVTGTRWTGALPPLALGTDYWWRVDIVGFGSTVKGSTWSFGIAPVNVAPRSLDLAFPVGSPVPLQQLALTAGAPLAWTATTSTPWISLQTSSGSTPASLGFNINLAGLSTGLKSGSITLQAGGETFTVPVNLRVLALNLTKLVPHPTRPVVYGINTAAAGEGFSHLLEIDAATANILRSMPVGFSPTDADIDPSGSRLYVTNWGYSQTRVIDLGAWQELAPLNLGTDIYKLEVASGGRLVTEGEDQWISLDLWSSAGTKLANAFSVREGDGEVDPTGNIYYHCDNNISNAHVTKYDISGSSFVQLAESPQFGGYGSRNLILSKDGSRLFWAGRAMNSGLQVLTQLPGEVWATSGGGELAIGESQVWWSDSGTLAAALPFASQVATVSASNGYLVRFNATTRQLHATAIQSIAALPGPWPRPGQVLEESPDRLLWSPVPAASAYRVFIASSAASLATMTVPTATVSTTYYDLPQSLGFGRYYHWRVDAVVPSGTGTVAGSVQSFGIGYPAGPALPVSANNATGIAAAMSDRQILVGVDGHAKLLTFDPATGATAPVQQLSLSGSDGSSSFGNSFGAAVAVDAGKAMVSAHGYDTPVESAGAAFLFRQGDFGYWQHAGPLQAPSPVSYDQFGMGLAASGNLLLAGTGGSNGIGRVNAYITEPAAVLVQTFNASDAVTADSFGRVIVMEGNNAIISAPGRGASYSRLPVLYAFTRSTTTGLWSQTQRIPIPGSVSYGNSGTALALSGNSFACNSTGSSNNSVLVFTKGGNGQWTQSATINRTSVTGASTNFGTALALAGDQLFIGDNAATRNGQSGGAVFSFRRSGSNWTQGPVIGPAESSYSGFGADLAVRDGWLLATGGSSTPAKLFRIDDAANATPAFRPGLATQVVTGRAISQEVLADDADGNATLAFDLLQGPAWLSLTPGVNGRAVLSGMPAGNSGDVHQVQLRVRDGDGGTALFTYQLSLLLPTDLPVLTLEPESRDAGEGQEVTLRAAVSGIGPFRWQWFRDGEPIPGANSPTLAFGDVDRTDAGSYSVTVSNIVGQDASAPALLEVHPANRFAGAWPTFGGSPGHTGFHPARLGRHTFMPAWTRRIHPTNSLNRPAVAGGRVFVSATSRFETGPSIEALSLTNGSPLWSHTIPSSNSINPPTWHNGTVYFQRGKGTSDPTGPQLIALDAATGANRWSAVFGAQWESYEAPAVTDDGIWINGGTYGGMYGFSPAGAQRFFVGLAQYDEWTPTISQGRLFSWVEGVFREHLPTDGSVLWSVDAGWDWSGWSMGTVCAVSGNSAVAFSTTEIVCIDLVSRSIRWRHAGRFNGSPAIADGRVYGIRDRALESFSLADGSPGPALTFADSLVSEQPLLLMDQLVVASAANTYVIDPVTMTLVRTLPGGGLLSYSEGYLLVAGRSGLLTAWYANGAPDFAEDFPQEIDAGEAAEADRIDLATHLVDVDPGDSATWSLVSVSNPAIFRSVAVDAATGFLSVDYNPWASGSSEVTVAAVDEAGNRTEKTIGFTLPEHPAPQLVVGSNFALNRQTGLYEQAVSVTNAGAREIGGFELRIGGLAQGLVLMNASMRDGDHWRVHHHQPVAAGATVNLVLTYYTPVRGTPLTPQVVASIHDGIDDPASPAAAAVTVNPGQESFAIDRFERLPDGNSVLGFPTQPGALYEIQYSPDLTSWKSAKTRIRAAGTRIEWTDRGSPETESHPAGQPARFYRAVLVE